MYYNHKNILEMSFFLVTETPCVKFYHPERREGKLLKLCTNECTCAEGKQDDVS